jgi:hypothetical protein
LEPIDIHGTSQLLPINWTLGIGDPTFVGWLTVIMYFVTSFFCIASARRKDIKSPSKHSGSQRRLWWFIAIVLILLGINKQLDLQTLMTEVGKMLAKQQGWYEQRREAQAFFIALILSGGLVSIEFVRRAYQKVWKENWLTFVGLFFLICFVMIRAASFHHIDSFLGGRFLAIKMNWILEIGGIICIMASAITRLKRRKVYTPDKIPHRDIFI